LIQLNYRDSRPIYEQIRDAFRKLIISGAINGNEKLPSVRTLATQLSINPNTIQRAYNELESEGYVFSIPGKGSFVCPVIEQNNEKIEKLKNKVREEVAELRLMGVSESQIEELFRGEEK